MVQIMGNGYLSLLVMVSATVTAIVTAAEGVIKRNNYKHMLSDTAIRLQFAWY